MNLGPFRELRDDRKNHQREVAHPQGLHTRWLIRPFKAKTLDSRYLRNLRRSGRPHSPKIMTRKIGEHWSDLSGKGNDGCLWTYPM